MVQTRRPQARFDAVFSLHHAAIQRYCLRRLPLDDVNDAVAEVFLVAWRRIEDLPTDRELPWLYGVARNVVNNERRRRSRHWMLRNRVSELADADVTDPETQLVRRFEDAAALLALQQLRAADREILCLKTWEELSNQEIADVVGGSLRAVDMRISRARKRLARAFADVERGSSVSFPKPRRAEQGGES